MLGRQDDRRSLCSLGIEDELSSVAATEPRNPSRNRHAPVIEEARMVHDDHQPLWETGTIGTAKLGDVGVYGELLTWEQNVGVGDCRLDESVQRRDACLGADGG